MVEARFKQLAELLLEDARFAQVEEEVVFVLEVVVVASSLVGRLYFPYLLVHCCIFLGVGNSTYHDPSFHNYSNSIGSLATFAVVANFGLP